MDFNVSTLIFTIINFIVMGSIIYLIYRGLHSFKRTKAMDRKLDRILELLENNRDE